MSEALKRKLVAECYVWLRSSFVRICVTIIIKNADMSSEKRCIKTPPPKDEGFQSTVKPGWVRRPLR